jgi:hypothetical protein
VRAGAGTGKTRVGYAASWYSWISPPSRSTAADPAEVDHVVDCVLVDRRWLAERRLLPERAVWAVHDVMRGVGREDVLEVTTADDQEPFEALAADAPDPALGVCPRRRRPRRRLDYTDPLAAGELVKLAREPTRHDH